MAKVSLIIDGQPVTAPEGQSVLQVALDNGIYIPNLCHIPGRDEPLASCRLCFVTVSGKERPVPACTEPATTGLVVSTRSEAALRLARRAFELLMASHAVDCAHCARNGSCELQKIARHLKTTLRPRGLRRLLKDLPVDNSHPDLVYDPNKCVLCERCVWACRQQGNTVLGMAHRGFGRRLTTFRDLPLGESDCRRCTACAEVCPTGALVPRKPTAARH